MTGAVLGMAPNFDNNMALISRGYAVDIQKTSHLLIDMFRDLIREKNLTYTCPTLTLEGLREVAQAVLPKENVDREYVARFVWMNYQRLSEI